MAQNIGSIFNFYDIMSTTLDNRPDNPGELGTNSISCQLGNAITGKVYTDSAEVWFPPGLAARPGNVSSGNPDDAPQSVSINKSDQDIVIATRDVTSQKIIGSLQPGETCLYAPGGNGTGTGRVIIKENGTIFLYTQVAPNSYGVYLKVAPNMLQFVAPWGRLIFDASGFHVSTSNGGRIDLSNANVPPLLVKSSVFSVTCGMATLDSPVINLGLSAANGGGVYMPAVYGALPPVAPGIPLLGVGVGAVTVAASSSTSVYIAI